MAYCDLQDVTQYAGITEPHDTALLNNLIERVSDMMDAHCKRKLVTATDTTRYFTPGRDTDGYWLFFDDVCADVTEVLNGDASQTEITSDEYVLRDANSPPYYALKIKSSKSKVWEWSDDPEDAISVTGKWAYYGVDALPVGVPDDIRFACVRWATYLYRQKDTSADVDRPLLTDSGVTIMPGGVPKDVAQILAPYVRRGR